MWNAIYYYVQATTRCTVGIFWYFYTRLLKILVFFVYKTKATRLRPRPDLQDQHQDQDRSLQDKDHDQFLLVAVAALGFFSGGLGPFPPSFPFSSLPPFPLLSPFPPLSPLPPFPAPHSPVARIVKTRRQIGRAPLPYPTLPFPALPSPPLPLEVGPLNPARGSGEAL